MGKRTFLSCCLAIALILTGYQGTNAQPNISSFVVYAGSGGTGTTTPPTGYGVFIGSSITVTGGKVGANTFVQTTGNATINADIHSHGLVSITNSNVVGGKITAANSAGAIGTILSVGSSTNISGNIDVNGNIVIGGGIVSGRVTHPVGTTYTGPTPGGGDSIKPPDIPQPPVMLPIRTFRPAGTTDITGTATIDTGRHRDVILTGNKTLTFTRPGVYIFNSFHLSGNSNRIVFNFRDSVGAKFYIYVHNDADFGKLSASLSNGGSANQIYTEVHGDGTTTSFPGASFVIANGSSGGGSKWLGTVWAPYAAINIGSGTGSSNLSGALYSNTQVSIQSGVSLVHAPFSFCEPPQANAGVNVSYTCPNQSIQLQGSSNIAGVTYSWYTDPAGKGVINSGANTSNPSVTVNGLDSLNKATFVLTVTDPNGGCSDTDTIEVSYIACVYPTIPFLTGKDTTIIGPLLTSLYNNPDEASEDIYILSDDNTRVMIEIIAISGQQNNVYNLLTTNTTLYGLTDTIDNALTPLIIAGSYPIANLLNLNALTSMIKYARPLYPVVNNTGLILSQGDLAMRTNNLRGGFSIDGDSIRVGVISDSYNKKGGAGTDITNGDLPGPGNPNGYLNPVRVLQDYPFTGGSDEGRAMLQIVHDIAPKASLSFRTGFLTASDFASGILQLRDDTCDVIVDDITFITEPFFQDGVVAQTVNQVVNDGVAYFTAAGNFGKKSYTKAFSGGTGYTLPAGVFGQPHEFAPGDIYQRISLKGTTLLPGKYTLVLQWEDAIYSQGQLTGTVNDLDIFLITAGGSAIGFNRDNIGEDPMEMLFFTVTSETEADILIVRAAGSSPVTFKFIGFRGDLGFLQHASGQSTIVGQANAEGAISVGAVLYSNTPAYGVSIPTIASFSSRGGMPISGVTRSKPDITAPNGVNTSINFGSINLENDPHPNFFGTSAAAPHAAGAAALLLQGRKKFTGHIMSPNEVRELMKSSAIDMGASGYDDSTGYGFIQPYVAMRTFAEPTAIIDELIYDASITPLTPPTDSFTLVVEGQYMSGTTQIIFRGEELETTIEGDSVATATAPPFTGNPLIQVYTPPIANGDGGYSNTIPLFSINQKDIVITVVSATKKFGDPLPTFTAEITVDDVPLASSGLTLANIGLESMTFETAATSTSNVGVYLVRAVRDFDTTDPIDIGLNELYNYEFVDGSLTVEQLAIQVEPNDQTIDFGDALTNITFNYTRTDGQTMSSQLTQLISSSHKKYLADNILGVVNGYPGSPAITPNQLANLSVMASFQAVANARQFTLSNGAWVPLPAGTSTFSAQYLVDVSAQSLNNYITNSALAVLEPSYPGVNNRSLIGANALVSGTAQANLNGNLVQMINGTLVQMVNGPTGTLVPIINGNLVQMINGTLVQLINGEPVPIPNSGLVQIINGNLVQLINGEFVAIPNGNLVQLINGTLVQMINGNLVQMVNGTNEPVLNGNLVQIINGTLVQMINGVAVPVANGTLVQMVNGTLVQLINGNLVQMVNGTLVQLINGNLVQIINGNLVQVINGVVYEIVNGTLVQVINGELQFVNSYQVGPNNNANAAVIVDAEDFSVQNGSIGAQFAINLVTSLQPGIHKIFPGALIDPNFKVSYLSGDLTVNAIPITITANNRTKQYGQALTLGTTEFAVTSGTLLAGDNITGVTLTSAGAAATAQVSGSPYSIVPSNPQGIDVSKYQITYVNGSLTITTAPFTVKADDKVIFRGDPIPNYTGTKTGLLNGDVANYTYTSPYTTSSLAGTYPITPVMQSFPNSGSYSITSINGTLYVNPKGSGAKKLRPYLDCVQEIMDPAPGEFRFVAHYFCENPNSTVVVVPIGNDNKIRSVNGPTAFDATNQPEFFQPGTTAFFVPFDGATLTWEIRTFESNHKASVASTASASSGRCSFTNIVATNEQEVVQTKNGAILYPNPATSTVTLQVENTMLDAKAVSIYDVSGRRYMVKVNGAGTGNQLVVDVSSIPGGLYLLRYESTSGSRVFRFIKQ